MDTSLIPKNIITEILKEILPENFHREISPEKELYAELNIDSRHFLEIIRGIESRLNYEIDDEDILNTDLVTIKDLINFVSELIVKQEKSSIHE